MKEVFLWVGWALAALFGWLNYKQSHELKRLRARIDEAEAAQARDHEAYRQILIEIGVMLGDENQARRISQRVDAIFARAFAKADAEIPPYNTQK